MAARCDVLSQAPSPRAAEDEQARAAAIQDVVGHAANGLHVHLA